MELDSEITDDLRREGYVRDLVRGIQNLRKESGLSVTDRIVLTVGGNAELKEAYQQFADFIEGETLASKSQWADTVAGGTDIEAGEAVWSAALVKA